MAGEREFIFPERERDPRKASLKEQLESDFKGSEEFKSGSKRVGRSVSWVFNLCF